MTLAPIVLFVFRRPEHTRKVLEALRQNPEAAASELFIFADGSRKPEEAPAVEAVRALCRSAEGFGRVTLVERPGNWGLARSVIAGVTEVCTAHGRVIVLEDDLLVSRHFLAYMNEALDRYAEADQVMQVSGHMFPVPWVGSADAAFLPMTTSWGWGTWQRAWRHFDEGMTGFERLQGRSDLQRAFDLDGSYPYFEMLCAQRAGRLDSWAICWWLTVYFKGGLTLFPAKPLVQNIGFDGTGTHCGSETELAKHNIYSQVLRFPSIDSDDLQFLEIKKYLYDKIKKPNLIKRLMRFLK